MAIQKTPDESEIVPKLAQFLFTIKLIRDTGDAGRLQRGN
jgi:hypothetical protein